jgi:3-hydroxyisobutyrate dehydrogenase
MANIAFIGLGNMGLPMAQNLVKAGHAVTGFDLSEYASERLASGGGACAQSIGEACAAAEVVITMLPAGEQVREVYLGHEGVLAAAPAAALLIDSSTIDAETARAVAQAAEASGFAMLDAPVSGGVAGAQGATLTFMVGGSDEGFERALPVLQKMGKTIVHAGGAGNGQAAKICNNMILGATMAATCEAFVLAKKLGLDLQTFFDISSKASGQSWSMTSYAPVPGVGPDTPADHDYEGGFAAALMLKDLKLAADAARSVGAYTPMGGEAEELYQRFVDRGGGSKDFSGIIKMIDDSWKVPDNQ